MVSVVRRYDADAIQSKRKIKYKHYVMMSASNQSTIQFPLNANEREPMHWAEVNDWKPKNEYITFTQANDE